MSRSIVIYANCQGVELQRTARYTPCLDGRVTVKWIPLHKLSAEDWNTQYTPTFLQDAVAVWEQVESGPCSEHRARLHERIPPDCQIVRFPPLTALCLWPFAGNDPRSADDPTRYPWTDSVAATLSAEALPDDALFDKYMQVTTDRMPDLARRLRMDMARWQASDDVSDINMADWIAANFTTTKLFHTSGHITAAAIGCLIRQLLTKTAYLGDRLARMAAEEADRLLRNHQGQDFESVPVHPLVADRLELQFHDPNALHRWHGHEWTFRQYILHYIRWTHYLD